MSAIALLRFRTAASHEAVDSVFGQDDLSDPDGYRNFLKAHARALPTAEASAAAVWPALRRRCALLEADLRALDVPVRLPVTTASEDGPAQWGALYVVEGSRLGGALLSKRVGHGLPVAYLSAVHLPGEWRAIRQAIDEAAVGRDDRWLEQLVSGAQATFALYEKSALQRQEA